MRVTELDTKTKAIRNWAAAQSDAESKGLVLGQNGKQWYLQPINYDEITTELKAKGLAWTDYYDLLSASIRNIKEYPNAAAKIVANMGDVPHIIKNVMDRKRAKAYDELQDMLQESMKRSPHGKPQLFVPRPQINTAKPDWYYRRVGYRFDDEGNRIKDDDDNDIKEAARPVLPPAPAHPKPGGTKPYNAFWTSSLKKEFTENGVTYYGSDWIDYVCGNMSNSYNNVGHVYRISPSARILTIRDTDDAKRIYQIYRNLGVNLNPQAEYDSEHYGLSKDFPWDEIRKHWDAIHHYPGFSDRYGFMYGYDCESTAWFNTDVLDYVGKVRIRPCERPRNDDDDEY